MTEPKIEILFKYISSHNSAIALRIFIEDEECCSVALFIEPKYDRLLKGKKFIVKELKQCKEEHF